MLQGNFPPLPTPMNGLGDVDLEDLGRLMAHLAPYVDGYTLSAGGGEFPSLTQGERLEMLRALSWLPREGKRIIFCVGSACMRDACELARAAEARGADALLFVPPFYYRPTLAGLRACLEELVAATALPIVYYDNPAHTRGPIPFDDLMRLFDGLPIVGVKMADPAKISRLASHPQHPGFCGLDKPVPEMWRAGAAGALVNEPITLLPDVYHRAWSLFRGGEAEAGLRLLETITMPFIEVASTGMDERYVAKWLLHRQGVLKNPATVRPPQSGISPEREAALIQAYDAALQRAEAAGINLR